MSAPATRDVRLEATAPLQRIEPLLYRFPLTNFVRTSFGVMRSRPALFVRVEDRDGAEGWGEVWCNFPQSGAEHRARLLADVFAPLLEGRAGGDPRDISNELTARTAVLAIQAGEPGPIQQCIAGIDIALWDLAARRAGVALWRLLGGTDPRIRVYASGINPDAPEKTAERCRAEGHRAFKLKVGFGQATDLANLRAMRGVLGPAYAIMVDANQAWALDEAQRMAAAMEPFGPGWLEEPLRADRPWSEWQALRNCTRIPLAGGENLAGDDAFGAAIAADALTVIQPDAAKWGGISGCLPVARRALAAGRRYCPHYLGGGIGLLASAHLLAAAGGDGLLEVDANENPLRALACGPIGSPRDGFVVLDEEPGLGRPPDQSLLRDYRACA